MEEKISRKKDPVADIQILCQHCREYLCFATQTRCHHVFCQQCIDNYLLLINQCPVCQKRLWRSRLYSNIALDNLIHQHIEEFDNQQLNSFQIRRDQYRSKFRFLKPQMLRKGEIIDVRNCFYVWCKGKIKQVKQIDKYLFIVTYNVKENDWQVSETFSANDRRLAILGTFTNNLEIPHYNSQQRIVFEKYNMCFQVVNRQCKLIRR